MWGWIVTIASNAAGVFFGNSGGISNTTVQDYTIGLFAAVQALSNFLQALLGDEMVAWKKAGPSVVEGAKGLGNLAFNELFAWNRLLHTIIPGSLKWLQTEIHKWAEPKFKRVWNFLGVLDRRTKRLDYWQAHFANPWIRRWITWLHFWQGWPNRTVATVHNWLEHPKLFAGWATPILVPSLLRWFSPPAHKTDRDTLTRAILATTPDVYHDAEQAAVAILDSQWP